MSIHRFPIRSTAPGENSLFSLFQSVPLRQRLTNNFCLRLMVYYTFQPRRTLFSSQHKGLRAFMFFASYTAMVDDDYNGEVKPLMLGKNNGSQKQTPAVRRLTLLDVLSFPLLFWHWRKFRQETQNSICYQAFNFNRLKLMHQLSPDNWIKDLASIWVPYIENFPSSIFIVTSSKKPKGSRKTLSS